MASHLHLEIPGLHNARDLGGLPMPGGRTPARLFVRADSLHALDAAGADQLIDYGVRTVIDLRHAEERACNPGVFERQPRADVRFHTISMNADPGLPGYEGMHHPGNLLLWNKRTLLLGGAYTAQVMRTIIDAPPGGVLFHCWSGKDRTGIVAQLLLLLAGVNHNIIIDDYMVTNERLAAHNAVWLATIEDPKERALMAHLGTVQHENIAHNLAFFDALGGAEGYLHSVGLQYAEIDALRARWESNASAS
jgi:protein-tyrosine phosphatase